jgi:hypothetical protein
MGHTEKFECTIVNPLVATKNIEIVGKKKKNLLVEYAFIR